MSKWGNGWNDTEIYSTSEVKTNKIWVNGKPIYRKVYTGSFSSGTVFATNVDELVLVSGYIENTSVKGAFPFGSPNVYASVNVNAANTAIAYTNTSYADSKIIIEYTKTTN